MRELKSNDEMKQVLGENDFVLVDFFAKWCRPCMQIAPQVEEMSKRYPNVFFAKIDSDNEDISDVVETCEIKQLPTFVIFVNGKYVDRLIGANIGRLEDFVRAHTEKNDA